MTGVFVVLMLGIAGTAIVAGLLARDTRTHRHDREGD